MTYESAFATAVSLLEDRQALARFIATVPEWADDLRRDIAIIQEVHRAAEAIEPRLVATVRAWDLAQATLRRVSAESLPSGRSRFSWLYDLRLSLIGRFAVGVACLTLILGGFIVLGEGSSSLGLTPVEAVRVEGEVSHINERSFALIGGDAGNPVLFDETTALEDGFGNPISASSITVGESVIVTAKPEGERLVAERLIVRDKLVGILIAFDGRQLTVRTSRSDYVVLVTATTEFEGTLIVGTRIEVELQQMDDGTLIAREVEVEENHGLTGDRTGANATPAPRQPSTASGAHDDSDEAPKPKAQDSEQPFKELPKRETEDDDREAQQEAEHEDDDKEAEEDADHEDDDEDDSSGDSEDHDD